MSEPRLGEQAKPTSQEPTLFEGPPWLHLARDEDPVTFEEAIDRILAECKRILVSKNRSYGKGNITGFGEFGVVVRANDKWERIKNLCVKDGKWAPRESTVANEQIEDTILDLANYMVIWTMLKRGWWMLPYKE